MNSESQYKLSSFHSRLIFPSFNRNVEPVEPNKRNGERCYRNSQCCFIFLFSRTVRRAMFLLSQFCFGFQKSNFLRSLNPGWSICNVARQLQEAKISYKDEIYTPKKESRREQRTRSEEQHISGETIAIREKLCTENHCDIRMTSIIIFVSLQQRVANSLQ